MQITIYRNPVYESNFATPATLHNRHAITTSANPDPSFTDSDVTDKIDAELQSDPAVTTDSIDIEARYGIVTLRANQPLVNLSTIRRAGRRVIPAGSCRSRGNDSAAKLQ